MFKKLVNSKIAANHNTIERLQNEAASNYSPSNFEATSKKIQLLTAENEQLQKIQKNCEQIETYNKEKNQLKKLAEEAQKKSQMQTLNNHQQVQKANLYFMQAESIDSAIKRIEFENMKIMQQYSIKLPEPTSQTHTMENEGNHNRNRNLLEIEQPMQQMAPSPKFHPVDILYMQQCYYEMQNRNNFVLNSQPRNRGPVLKLKGKGQKYSMQLQKYDLKKVVKDCTDLEQLILQASQEMKSSENIHNYEHKTSAIMQAYALAKKLDEFYHFSNNVKKFDDVRKEILGITRENGVVKRNFVEIALNTIMTKKFDNTTGINMLDLLTRIWSLCDNEIVNGLDRYIPENLNHNKLTGGGCTQGISIRLITPYVTAIMANLNNLKCLMINGTKLKTNCSILHS